LKSSHDGEKEKEKNLQEDIESIASGKEGKVIHHWAIQDEQP
jgi:hypothetical protein